MKFVHVEINLLALHPSDRSGTFLSQQGKAQRTSRRGEIFLERF